MSGSDAATRLADSSSAILSMPTSVADAAAIAAATVSAGVGGASSGTVLAGATLATKFRENCEMPLAACSSTMISSRREASCRMSASR